MVGRLAASLVRDPADEPTGEAGDALALAPSAGPLAVDLSPPRRSAAGRCQARGADCADGAGEPGLGLPADPGRAARPGRPGRRLHDTAGAETVADTASAA